MRTDLGVGDMEFGQGGAVWKVSMVVTIGNGIWEIKMLSVDF